MLKRVSPYRAIFFSFFFNYLKLWRQVTSQSTLTSMKSVLKPLVLGLWTKTTSKGCQSLILQAKEFMMNKPFCRTGMLWTIPAWEYAIKISFARLVVEIKQIVLGISLILNWRDRSIMLDSLILWENYSKSPASTARNCWSLILKSERS